MNAFFTKNYRFSRAKKFLLPFVGLIVTLCLCLLVGCKKSVCYADYVSELRDNVFLAKTETFSLRIYSVRKESPYNADGIPQETSQRTEIYLIAPEGDENCFVQFTINGKEYGGEMSFDNVRAEYYLYCTLDTSAEKEIVCNIKYGETQTELTTKSVRTENTLSATEILNILLKDEKPLFDGLTDKYGFAGEIYIRLIFEESPFYYVGVIDRNGNITAFLLSGETGKILAKRTS